jgi:hypothetical protein
MSVNRMRIMNYKLATGGYNSNNATNVDLDVLSVRINQGNATNRLYITDLELQTDNYKHNEQKQKSIINQTSKYADWPTHMELNNDEVKIENNLFQTETIAHSTKSQLNTTYNNSQQSNILATHKRKSNHKLKFNKDKLFNISTYNVRSLGSSIGKFHELCKGCTDKKLDIVCIQEIRWKCENKIERKWNSTNTYQLIYCSASSEGHGGIGILVSRKFATLIKSIEVYSERIMMIDFNSNPIITVLCCYAPTNVTNDTQKIL